MTGSWYSPHCGASCVLDDLKDKKKIRIEDVKDVMHDVNEADIVTDGAIRCHANCRSYENMGFSLNTQRVKLLQARPNRSLHFFGKVPGPCRVIVCENRKIGRSLLSAAAAHAHLE